MRSRVPTSESNSAVALASALKPVSHLAGTLRLQLEKSEDALGEQFDLDLDEMMGLTETVEISTVAAQKLKEMFAETKKHPIHYGPMVLRLQATLEAVEAVAGDSGE